LAAPLQPGFNAGKCALERQLLLVLVSGYSDSARSPIGAA